MFLGTTELHESRCYCRTKPGPGPPALSSSSEAFGPTTKPSCNPCTIDPLSHKLTKLCAAPAASFKKVLHFDLTTCCKGKKPSWPLQRGSIPKSLKKEAWFLFWSIILSSFIELQRDKPIIDHITYISTWISSKNLLRENISTNPGTSWNHQPKSPATFAHCNCCCFRWRHVKSQSFSDQRI